MDESVKAWYEMRKHAIFDRVQAHDVLRLHGLSFKHAADRIEQISCPFHGRDEDPSARVWPGNASEPSHVYCYVCRERWDVIDLWRKYNGGDFHRTLSDLERKFGLTTPPVPEGAFAKGAVPQNDLDKQEFQRLYKACEQRLIGERDSYDMRGYLVAGSILDKALAQTSASVLSFKDGTKLMLQLMQKIGERVRGVSSNQAADP